MNKKKSLKIVLIFIVLILSMLALTTVFATTYTSSSTFNNSNMTYNFSLGDTISGVGNSSFSNTKQNSLYCVWLGQHIGSSSTYKVTGTITIEGAHTTWSYLNSSNQTVSGEGTVDTKYNAKMAYIVGGGTWNFNYGAYRSTGRDNSARQLAIWSFWPHWVYNLFTYQGVPEGWINEYRNSYLDSSGNVISWSKLDSYLKSCSSTSNYNEYKKIIEAAEEYAEERR